MDNQHRKITGYRELSQAEIDLMNEVKAAGIQLEALVEKVRNSMPLTDGRNQRWSSIGATHLQEGLMALTRAVAKPEFF